MKIRQIPFFAAGVAIFAGLASQQASAQNATPKFFNPTQELETASQQTNVPALVPNQSLLASWWNGPGATGNWFGLGKYLKANGLTVTGDYQANYYGNTTGGYRTGSAFDEQIKLGFAYDFETLFGLKGLKAYSNLRYRDGDDVNNITGAADGFNPSNIQSGKELRLMAQYLEYTTDNNVLLVNAGWMNPYDQFLQQPLAKLFMNNQIASNKGLGANMGGGAAQFWPNNPRYNGNTASRIPWSSSYDSWGGTLKVKPTKETYAMSGLYMAIPNASGAVQAPYSPTQVAPYSAIPQSKQGTMNPASHGTMNNNGLSSFGGAGWNAVGAGQPNGNSYNNPNGLYSVTEFGWEPKFGKDKLEGKYAFGMIWWGIQNQNFQPVVQTGSGKNAKAVDAGPFNMGAWAFYWQADQMLYRAHEPAESVVTADGKNVVDSKNPAEVAKSTLSKKGLYMFNAFTFSPQQYSLLDFYYQTGLVYQGLLPGRPDDRMGLALGTAWFSADSAAAYSETYAIQSAANTAAGKTNYAARPQPSWGGVLEFDYQFMVNKWFSVKPFAEYIMNPQQNGTLGNELVLGSQVAMKF
jgi:carbohydrate-selective porin OprB